MICPVAQLQCVVKSNFYGCPQFWCYLTIPSLFFFHRIPRAKSCDWASFLDARPLVVRPTRRWWLPYNETLSVPRRSAHLSCGTAHAEFLVSLESVNFCRGVCFNTGGSLWSAVVLFLDSPMNIKYSVKLHHMDFGIHWALNTTRAFLRLVEVTYRLQCLRRACRGDYSLALIQISGLD